MLIGYACCRQMERTETLTDPHPRSPSADLSMLINGKDARANKERISD